VYEYHALDRSAADMIIAVDGKKVTTADGFLTLIESKQPGQEVVLTVIRDGRETPVKVQLGASDGG
jgi:putative serine protease PepD